MANEYKVHAVLAGAYRESNPKSFLYHASFDGDVAVCRRVKPGNLCDEYGTELGQGVTCPTCLARIEKRGLVQAAD